MCKNTRVAKCTGEKFNLSLFFHVSFNVFYFTFILENTFTDDYLHLHQWIRVIHIASCNCLDHFCKIQVCLLVFIMSGNQRMGESLKRIHITFTNYSKLNEQILTKLV